MKFTILCVAGIVCVSVSAHDLTVENQLGTNRFVTIGAWTFHLADGQRHKWVDVPAGASVVSSNGGWTLYVDDYLSTNEAQRARLIIASSNGVENVLVFPGTLPAGWVNLGKWIAFSCVGFAIAMSLARLLKAPLREGE